MGAPFLGMYVFPTQSLGVPHVNPGGCVLRSVINVTVHAVKNWYSLTMPAPP